MCIFIISFVTPAGTRNPPETRGCGCGCRNAPAGLPAGGFFPTPRVCLRAGFHQTRTHIRGCHPYFPFHALHKRPIRWRSAIVCRGWITALPTALIIFPTIKSAGSGSNGASTSPDPPPLRIARRRIRTRLRLAAGHSRLVAIDELWVSACAYVAAVYTEESVGAHQAAGQRGIEGLCGIQEHGSQTRWMVVVIGWQQWWMAATRS